MLDEAFGSVVVCLKIQLVSLFAGVVIIRFGGRTPAVSPAGCTRLEWEARTTHVLLVCVYMQEGALFFFRWGGVFMFWRMKGLLWQGFSSAIPRKNSSGDVRSFPRCCVAVSFAF